MLVYIGPQQMILETKLLVTSDKWIGSNYQKIKVDARELGIAISAGRDNAPPFRTMRVNTIGTVCTYL